MQLMCLLDDPLSSYLSQWLQKISDQPPRHRVFSSSRSCLTVPRTGTLYLTNDRDFNLLSFCCCSGLKPSVSFHAKGISIILTIRSLSYPLDWFSGFCRGYAFSPKIHLVVSYRSHYVNHLTHFFLRLSTVISISE